MERLNERLICFEKLFTVGHTPISHNIKSLTIKMSNIDHLTRVQYSAGKPRILTFIWKPKKAACPHILGVLYLLKAQNPCGSFLLYIPEATNKWMQPFLPKQSAASQSVFCNSSINYSPENLKTLFPLFILSKLSWKEKRALEEYLKRSKFHRSWPGEKSKSTASVSPCKLTQCLSKPTPHCALPTSTLSCHTCNKG